MRNKDDEDFLGKYGEDIPYCDAIYTPSNLPEHKGNPLIEALPVYVDGNEPLEYFANYPFVDARERRRSVAYRLNALGRLRTFIETMPWHFGVMRDIYRVIWQGYVHRNPLLNQRELVRRRYRLAKEKGILIPMYDVAPSHSATFGLLGASGIGKSTAVLRCLSFLPQFIRHPQHNIQQIVWLKVECPPDGSLSQMMEWILEEVDHVLDSGYRNRIKKIHTLDDRMRIVGEILRNHWVGLLVIDEIQNVLRDAMKRFAKIDFF